MTAALTIEHEAAAVSQRATKAAALRRLLSDGRWHTATELERVGGRRFGGRLHELRRGDDGGTPLEVEGERVGDRRGDCEWRYRVVPAFDHGCGMLPGVRPCVQAEPGEACGECPWHTVTRRGTP